MGSRGSKVEQEGTKWGLCVDVFANEEFSEDSLCYEPLSVLFTICVS